MSAPTRCRRCHRRLTDPVYAARGTGRVCGGRQHTARVRRAVTRVRAPARPECEEQLELDLDGEG